MSAKVSVFANGGIVASPADRWSFLRRLLPGEWVSLLQYQVGVVTVSPDAAAEILEKHHGSNRPLQRPGVGKIVRCLLEGTFQLNGETVVFDDNLKLRQGRHRMTACRDCGEPFETFVVCNVPEKAWSSFDRHSRRAADQVIAAVGVKANREVAAAVRVLAGFQRAGVVQRLPGGRLSIDDILDWYRLHPQLVQSGELALSFGRSRSLFQGGAYLCALHYIFSRVDRQLADRFFTGIATRSIPSGDEWAAVRMLAERLQSDAVADRKMPPPEMGALTIKAWNAVRDGQTVRRLRLQANEDYPKVSGLAYADGKPIITGGFSNG